MNECDCCGRTVAEWPKADCEAPELHLTAIYGCDCGDTVTVADAIADPRRHRRCHLIDAGAVNLGALTATFLICLVGTCLFLLAVVGGQHAMCHVDRSHSYCEQAR